MGKVTLALIGTANHGALDGLAARYEPGSALCVEILEAKSTGFSSLLDSSAPLDPVPQLRQNPESAAIVPDFPLQAAQGNTAAETAQDSQVTSELLDAIASLPERKSKNGSGRAAASLSRRFSISPTTIYQARKVLKHGSPSLVNALRQGEIPIKTAFKRLSGEQDRAEMESKIEQAR